ncbi:Uncharacterized protein dnm_042940 [Desulfonema magnum]|uniref:Uncharacterized protein n=1 Tax=Desulfonema magnum TaxID=45655 RepID=A0A975BMG8_9BACT|nr:Uncharacterized protein dnm_042940 [Desulfonema magnum]
MSYFRELYNFSTSGRHFGNAPSAYAVPGRTASPAGRFPFFILFPCSSGKIKISTTSVKIGKK